jgi:hypothetical protein
MGRIRTVQEARNQLIHGVWAKDDDGKFYIVWHGGKKTNRLLGKPIQAETEDLQRVADEAMEIVLAFLLWWDFRHHRSPPTEPTVSGC